MKYLYILILPLFFSISHAQKSKINFGEIKKEVQDSTSKYFYERLVYRFQYDPAVLDSAEIKHLYYGKFFTKNKLNPLSKEKLDFIDEFHKNSPDIIPIANTLLFKDPADMEVLAVLLQIYSKQTEDSEEFGLRAMQLRRLLENVLRTSSQEEDSNYFTVMSVPDEYVLAGFLKINLQTYKRTSTTVKDAILDQWKDGKKKVTFRVMQQLE